tara:strand:+ start:2497 stop:2922 length:426 start_codon:yes stop_codon:yes gene_type:complete
MKIDYTYLKDELLPVFLNSSKAFVSFDKEIYLALTSEDISKQEVLAFHWYLLCDQSMVEAIAEIDPKKLFKPHKNEYLASAGAVRLTFTGQEFAQSLCKANSAWIGKIKNFGIDAAGEVLKRALINEGTQGLNAMLDSVSK